MFDLDVVIPTAKQLDRLDNLVCLINIVQNSGINSRAYIVMQGEYPELMERMTQRNLDRMEFCKTAPQGHPCLPIEYALGELELSEWFISIADDDCLLPWGLKHLFDATKDIVGAKNLMNSANIDKVGMVIGQTLGVSRVDHYDLSLWKIGIGVIPCHVSTALVNVPMLRKLERPWLPIDPLADYLLIKRMSETFPYKIIPNVVHCQAFADVENLGEEFGAYFKKTYGHLL